VTNAQLGEQGIDGSGLYTPSPALNSQVCRIDMIFPIRNDQWERTESINDLSMRLRL
jgi:hypothetical protein